MKQQMGKGIGKSRVRGFSLMELMIVFVIIAIAGLVVLSKLSNTSTARKTQAEIDGLTSIIGATKLYKTGGTYGTGELTAVLVHSNKIPTATYNVASDGKTVTNQWGGALTVTGVGSKFRVQDKAVPSDVCSDVVTAIGNSETTITVTGLTKTNGVITAVAANTFCGTSPKDITFEVTG